MCSGCIRAGGGGACAVDALGQEEEGVDARRCDAIQSAGRAVAERLRSGLTKLVARGSG